MKCCPTCGQTLPPEKIPGGERLRGKKYKMVHALHKAGANGLPTQVLFDRMYGDDPEGGPETGIKVIAVFAWHVNKILKLEGYRVHGTRGRCEGNYVLEKLAR